MKDKKVIFLPVCGFPGVGKTRASQNYGWHDSDSSKFSWSAPNVRHPDWPANYMQHIKESTGIIMISTHEEVRKALKDARIKYVLCYPERHCKDEYLARYNRRGSSAVFCELLARNWDAWIDDLNKDDWALRKIVLGPGQYIMNVDWDVALIEGARRDIHQHPPINFDKGFESIPASAVTEVAPSNIQTLAPNEIFVFGSNLAGRHGAGAAKLALERFGAVYGQGVGLQGQSYGIPTKDAHLRVLPRATIWEHVRDFIKFARSKPRSQVPGDRDRVRRAKSWASDNLPKPPTDNDKKGKYETPPEIS